MNIPASRGEVTTFLSAVKKCIAEKRITFVTREKNVRALIALGIEEPEAWQAIRSLAVRHYHRGPEQDYEWQRFEGDVWIFGSSVRDRSGKLQPVYIKLKIGQENGRDYLLCLSFHKADPPLYCPLR